MKRFILTLDKSDRYATLWPANIQPLPIIDEEGNWSFSARSAYIECDSYYIKKRFGVDAESDSFEPGKMYRVSIETKIEEI